jgi:CTP synthase
MKFIFVSGGVISGLGKGITTASIALLLKSRGLKVAPVKADMYLNIDAGTMNPLEHGEIFVTNDGTEADQDLGHYERFLDQTLNRENYITAGEIYQTVLNKERALEYDGNCVDAYLHIPEEIMKRYESLGKKADVVIIEYGGTVGEYQNVMFFEAARRMMIKHGGNVLFIHVGYLPLPASIGEIKTKPIQQSVWQLHELDIITNPDVPSIYEVPLLLEAQGMAKRILKKLKLKQKRKNLKDWQELNKEIQADKRKVKIGMIGKYYTSGGFSLEDSYVSVVEAIKHAAWANDVEPKIIWFDSEKLEKLNKAQLREILNQIDAMIVPQGWGSRGVEGKIKAIQYARENQIPYLGLCFGMQMAVIEFGRNVLELKRANSTEVNPKTPHPVIHIMPDQKEYLEKKQYGGTIRLGAWKCRVLAKTKLAQTYGKPGIISERHRHRYEFNNQYKQRYQKAGMRISGVSPDGKLVEAIEIPDHPFFIGSQFHPEYLSTPLHPHPLFIGLIKAAIEK